VKDGAWRVLEQGWEEIIAGKIALNNLTTGDVSVSDFDDNNVVRSCSLKALY
tara:strand:+ start:374 stop:529 length:156 start_codon:yes stop_codon:yes gene_type:complete